MLVLPCLLGLAVTAAPTSSDAPDRLSRALAAEKGGNETQALEQLTALVKAEPAWELPRLEGGRLLLKRGERLDEAEGWLDGARSLAPENARAHFLWAQVMEERGQSERARHSLEVALTLRNDYDDARFRLAGLLSSMGDHAGSAALYRAHLKAHPELLGVKLQLAAVLEKAGDLKAAEAELKSLLHGPQKDVATRRLIDFYNRHGRAKEAKHLAAAAIRTRAPCGPSNLQRDDPMTATLWMLATVMGAAAPEPSTAEVLKELRKIESAGYRQTAGELRLEYAKQAQQRPGDPTLRVYLAWCEYPSDESWNQFKAITQQFPDNAWAHLGMGLVYAKWKMKQQAQAEYDGILKRDPKFYPAITATADLLMHHGDPAGAEKKYRETLAMADDAGAHAGLGRLLLSQGKKDQAVPELEKAVAQWPDQPAVLRALLTLEIEEKRTAKATEVATRIAELAPRDREIRKTLADLRYESGDKAGAAQDYERLLRLGNPEAPVLTRLAELYKDLNKPDDEQRTLQLLSTLDKTNAAPSIRIAEIALAKDATDVADGHLAEALERDPKSTVAHLMAGKLKEKKGVLHEALEHFRQAGSEGQAPAAELEKKIELPKKPAKGSVDAIYGTVAKDLGEFLVVRKKANPKLSGGVLKYRVKVLADGTIEAVEVLDDTVGDPTLTAHVYFGLKEATFPKQRREPVFEFEVAGKKGKK